MKAEWLYNYDEFVNLYDYDDPIRNTSPNDTLSAAFDSWWNSIPMSGTRKGNESN
jgi:hypothetical protein